MSDFGSGSDIVAGMIAKIAQRDNSSPEDYHDDEGYPVCHVCHERKQLEIDMLGHLRRVPRMCACAREKDRKRREDDARAEAALRIKRLQEKGIADPKYLKSRIENDDRSNPKISDAVKRYVDKWNDMREKNIGILFYGNVGTGKTFFAACIANGLIDKGIGVLMTSVPSLITAMSRDFESDKTRILNDISNVPLFVLDDIGTERNTAYGYEKLQEIIDTRYRSGKPLIVTTNLAPSELQNPEDIRYKRVYDRMLEMCHPILVDGASRRVQKARAMRSEAKEILGL